MTPKYLIGVDISKLTLDIAMIDPSGQINSYKIDNTEEAIIKFMADLKTEYGFLNREVTILAENMAIFGIFLLKIAIKKRYPIYMESALRIKRSLGIQRGKNDKLDAIRIAQYAKKNFPDLKLWAPPRECIQKLKMLATIRKRLVKIRTMLSNGEKSYSDFMAKPEKAEMRKYCFSTVTAVSSDISAIETEMLSIVENDERLSRLLELLTSIPFIGDIVAVYLIIHTNEFKDFSEPKKFASYCGVAPFEYSSGTSISRRTKVSQFANKEMKAILHFAGLGYISKPGYYFLSKYYQRKVAEGKNKMSVLNAMRNKLISRIFSCISSNKKFVDI